MIEIYCCRNCTPCTDAIAWMDKRNIKYTAKGMISTIDEYPTIIVNGTTIVGWSEVAQKMISEAIQHD